MAVYINRLNGGDITIGSGGGSPAPEGNAETRFTLGDGSAETYNITGTLDQQWMIDNGFIDETDESWIKLINQVDIGNTVTGIGFRAFLDCDLLGVTIPDSVTSIGESAFHGCYNLTSVTIPSSVTSIGALAFELCESLTSITVLGKTTAQAQTLLANASVPEGCTITGELG